MQRYIRSHTSMRGVAALLVVLYHLQFGTVYLLPVEKATPFLRVGYLWVDLFFVLSGFVIAYSAQTDERAPFDREQLKAFWLARVARIYPLHLFALLALLAVTIGEELVLGLTHGGVALGALFSSASILNFLEQLFLLNAWGLTGRVGWNIPSWSIGAEMVAYAVFPLLAALTARRRRTALALMTLLPVIFYLWVATTTGVLDIVKGIAVLRCLAGFSLGMVVYALRERIAALPDALLGAMQAGGLLLVLATMILGLNDVLVMPGFVLLIAATWTDRGWLAAPLTSRPLHWLGEISYSVYLNHFWVLSGWHFVMLRVLAWLGVAPWIGRCIVIAGAIMLVLAVSHITYRLIERPARRAIVEAYRDRRARRMALAPAP